MALVACSECGNQVSDKAESCPSCGNPIKQQKNIDIVGTPIHTIQETSKNFKIVLLIAWSLMLIGVFLGLLGNEGNSLSLAWLGLLGFVLYVYAKFQIWWNHK